MANKIQQRRDTAYNWSHVNPILSSGEFGFETDTGKIKIGDGNTRWSSLVYFTSGSGGGSNVADDLTGTIPSAVLGNSSAYIGTTPIPLNRVSGSLTLSGVNITGYASALKSATTTINISTATAPSTGQVLTAINDSSASWQTLPGIDLNSASGVLAVSHGGTGVTTSTGTGSVVLKSSPTVSTALLTDSTTFNLLNTVVTAVNFAGAANNIQIGSGLPGSTTINHDLFVAGDLTYAGQATVIHANNVSVDNALIYLAENNTTDLLDIGILGSYNTTKFTGFIRDASDSGTWKLFSNLNSHPGNTADFSSITYDNLRIGGLIASAGAFSGALTATTGAFSGALTATSGSFSSQITGTQLVSTIATGTAPIVVSSSTPVTGLNIGGYASALKSESTSVVVSGSAAPSVGQVLTATSSTSAVWSTPSTVNLTNATGILGVTQGGTGVTTATGTGSVVLSANPKISSSLGTLSTTFNIINTGATTVNFAGAATNLQIAAGTGTTTINNALQVAGNITFGGTSTQLSATQLHVDDTLIYMARNNAADIFDIGIIGSYNTTKFSGLVRDASDATWKLFKELTTIPTTTVDFTQSSFANLQVGVLSSTQLVSTVSTGTAPLVVTSATPVPGLNIDGYSTKLKSATTTISIATAVAPTAGQVLTAISGTLANWQTPDTASIPTTSVVISSETPPVNPVENELWYDTASERLYVYYLSDWVDTNPATPVTDTGSITTGDTNPTSATIGDLWFDTVSGRLYVYYSNTWIDTNPDSSKEIQATSITGILPVSHGGTGVDTSSGSGSVVLNTNPTISSSILTDSTTFELVNDTVNIVNFAGSANSIHIGSGLPGRTTINHDLHIGGDLTYAGQATVIHANNVSVDNALIYLAENNPTDLFDIGILGSYDTTKFSGFIRDASDSGTWKLFSNLTTHPGNTVDFSNATYDDLYIGELRATSSTLSGALVAATGTLSGGLVAATGTFSGALSATTGTFSGALSATTGTFTDQITTTKLVSTVNTGIAPIQVSSSTPVSGLNILGYSGGLKTASNSVNVSTSAAPTVGQVLTATSSTTAVWSTPTSSNTNLNSATGVLGVLHGGTGVTTATGTGSVMLNTNPAIINALTTTSTSFNLINTNATTVNIAGASTDLHIASSDGITTINNTLHVAGNITFGGTPTQLSATQLQVDDTIIYMASGNDADIFDVGIIGSYNISKFTGLIRDASDATWKLFKELSVTPTTTVDFDQSEFADLQVGILSATQLVSNVATGTAPLVVTSATPVPGLNIDGYSTKLKSATTVITIGNSTAPTAGQVLTAISGSVAEWQNPSTGGGSIVSGETPPENPTENELWFDTTGGRLYVYYSNAWVDTNPDSGSSGSGSITTGSTAPTNPSVGDLWFDSIGGRLYVYYSNTWVDTNPDLGSSGASSTTTAGTSPTNPSVGDLWYNTTTDRLFIYYSDTWLDTNPLPVDSTLRYCLSSSRSLTNSTSIQSLFGVGVALTSDTRYEYKITGTVYKDEIIPTILQYASAGTANIAQHAFTVLCSESLTQNNSFGSYTNQPALSSININSNYSTPTNIASGDVTGATYYNFAISGVVDITTAGTFNPQIAFDNLPGNGLVMPGTRIELIPIGSIGVNTTVGSWTA